VNRSARLAAVVVAVVLLVTLGVTYTVQAARRADPRRDTGQPGPATVVGPVRLADRGRLVFRNAASGPHHGYLASVAVADPAGVRTVRELDCERVYAGGGQGLCLTADRGAVTTTYRAVVLDADLRELRRVRLPGAPSRARLSPDGRMASWTVFVSGDSYAGTNFSTRSGILDTRTGSTVANLETFTVSRDGARYQAPDVNVWGVTFTADDNRFYATMGSQGRTWLVEGDYARRRMRTLRENVECPSLSPDGTRLVYKKRVNNGGRPWRLHVLELAAGREVALAENASVDDQAAWLDEHTVMYGLTSPDGGSAIMAVPADGGGAPRLLVADATSPAVLR
jgi:hypothetical protein